MGIFFEEIFHFAKKAEFSLKGGWGTSPNANYFESIVAPLNESNFLSIFP